MCSSAVPGWRVAEGSGVPQRVVGNPCGSGRAEEATDRDTHTIKYWPRLKRNHGSGPLSLNNHVPISNQDLFPKYIFIFLPQIIRILLLIITTSLGGPTFHSPNHVFKTHRSDTCLIPTYATPLSPTVLSIKTQPKPIQIHTLKSIIIIIIVIIDLNVYSINISNHQKCHMAKCSTLPLFLVFLLAF